jgi:hypothetical protein
MVNTLKTAADAAHAASGVAKRLMALGAVLMIGVSVYAADTPTEADYYKIVPIPIPEEMVVEATGLELLPDGKLAVGTRRGDIFMVDGAMQDDPAKVKFTKWASGMQEVLGMAYKDGWLYAIQRAEISRLKDKQGLGVCDTYETFCDDFGNSGDYHEYNFMTKFDKDGNLYAVLCLTGSFTSQAPYRGWCIKVTSEGKMVPICAGIRSPGGIGYNAKGELFYTDNQGTWNGASNIKYITPGSFQGNTEGLRWYELPLVKETLGKAPETVKSESRSHIEMVRVPQYTPPPVFLTHGKIGNSTSGIVADTSGGKFGPFAGQEFACDQSASNVARLLMEKINGRYQGAVIMFREGFGSGNVPIMQAPNGEFIVGGTNRGWGSRGVKPGAVERLVWTGKTPFEVLEMHVKPDGFELTFTEPVDRATAENVKSYDVSTFTYIFHSGYGSPEVDPTTPTISKITVSDDNRKVRLVIDKLVVGSLHDLKMPGLRCEKEKLPLLHAEAWYTLWEIPKE